MASIRVLPKDVVDRIAAGEVVQRPANALKELLENSLDAGSTKIMVHVEKSAGSGKQQAKMLDFSISDNGFGIGKEDLEVAATRFATSKLSSVDDFSTLTSFGFRGEALASISMVSHLTITSRTKASPLAHECHYLDGKPQPGHPKRCARTVGTTVKVQDLFYNVPHRRRALNPKDEYTRMINMLQPYAVQVARRSVGIIVQQQQNKGKSSKTLVDLNTSNLSKVSALSRAAAATRAQPESSQEEEERSFLSPQQQEATKQVIKTIYGSHWEHHLLYFQSQSCTEEEDSSNKTMSYTCEGFLTSPSLAASSSVQLQLKNAVSILFINSRYVECQALKRRLEDAYATLTPWKKPPFVYLSIHVPANHVDVNVHPTKTQVALLFLEEIVSDLATKVHQLLNSQGQTFGEKQSKKIAIPVENPYLKKPSNNNQAPNQASNGKASADENRKRKRAVDDEEVRVAEQSNPGRQPSTKTPPPSSSQTMSQRRRSSSASSTSTYSKPPRDNKLVRTRGATPIGALEPFLVRKSSQSTTGTPSTAASTPPPSSTIPSSQESSTSDGSTQEVPTPSTLR